MTQQLAARFQRFAEVEAHGSSPLTRRWRWAWLPMHRAKFLGGIPEAKRQPNLLFGCSSPSSAVRRADWPTFPRHVGRESAADVEPVMLERRSQTNEPGRARRCSRCWRVCRSRLLCSKLVRQQGCVCCPIVWLRLRQTMCRIIYWRMRRCFLAAPTPRRQSRDRHCRWSHGDLVSTCNPLDVGDIAEHAAWLETLVWPEHDVACNGCVRALTIARRDPPPVVQGDLISGLCLVCAAGSCRVATWSCSIRRCWHTSRRLPLREEFADVVRRSGAVWVSNETPGVFRSFAAPRGPRGAFLLAVDGVPQAWTDPHGGWIEWIDEGEITR